MAPATETSMAPPVGKTFGEKRSPDSPDPCLDAPRRISSSHKMFIFMQAIYILMFTWMSFVYIKSDKEDIRNLFGPSIAWLADFGIVVPLVLIPSSCVNVMGVLMCNPFDRPKVTKTLYDSPFICFRTVTKGISPRHVTRCILRNKNTCLSAGLSNFEIEAVTDNVLNLPKEKHIRETLVPNAYKSNNNTKYKGRALHYCLEPGVNHLANDDWVVHLDEESLLSEESIVGICEFIHEKRGDIGQGPVTCSSALGEVIPSWLCSLADCYRVGFDYCLMRFQLDFLNNPIFGFKGSYIVLKNKTGVEIGFDSGPEGSVTEDCYFALKAWSRGYKFGYIKGEIREQSPFSMVDYIRQRRRWFMGHVYICFAQHLPFTAKLGIGANVLGLLLSPLGIIASIVNTFCPFFPLYQTIMVGMVSGCYTFTPFLGTYMSFRDRPWPTWRLILISLFSSLIVFPVGFTLHLIGGYWGLATLNAPEFHIVQKDANLFDKKKQ